MKRTGESSHESQMSSFLTQEWKTDLFLIKSSFSIGGAIMAPPPHRLTSQKPTLVRVKKQSYSCDQCPKFFSQDDKLRIHLRTNTCKKPSYFCNQCPKFFSQDGKLIIHQRTNTCKKPSFILVINVQSFSHKMTN